MEEKFDFLQPQIKLCYDKIEKKTKNYWLHFHYNMIHKLVFFLLDIQYQF